MTVPFTSVHIQIVHNLYKVNPPLSYPINRRCYNRVIDIMNMNMVDSSSLS